MSSSAPQTAPDATPAQQVAQTQDDNIEEEEIAIDHSNDTDSAFRSSIGSRVHPSVAVCRADCRPGETTSIASQYRGYIENGRRYQSVRSEEYFIPGDEMAWQAMEAGHMLMLIMDSQHSNTLFRSTISPKWQHILDIGCGSGDWCLDVADRYQNITVHGVDLMAPPQPWTAPNCIFEVDDVTKDWTWQHKFDLVHMRHMLGALSHHDWTKLYKRIYDNLQPGGWIEQVELDVDVRSVDDSLPQDSPLRWGKMFREIGEKSGRPFDVQDRMFDRISSTGFINCQKQEYKIPIGTWPQLQVYKDAGRVNKTHFEHGMEGWTIYLLTKHGLPTPWTPEEVQVWLAKCRQDVNAGYRIYQRYVRVWAQKPYDSEPTTTP